jgi:hypothetical protein
VSIIGWINVLILVLPMIGFLIWWIIIVSVVRIPSGSLNSGAITQTEFGQLKAAALA